MATFLLGFLTRRAKKPLGFAIIDLNVTDDEITDRLGGHNCRCESCRGRAAFEEVRDAAYKCGANPKGFIEAYVFDVTRCGHIEARHKHRLLKADDRVALGIRQLVDASGIVH